MTMSCDVARDLAPGFVLGALEPNEEAAVREHLAACDKAHPAFDAFGGVVQYLDETVELIEPPASLKARVLAAAVAERGLGDGPDVEESLSPRASNGTLPGTPRAPIGVMADAPFPDRRRAERRSARPAAPPTADAAPAAPVAPVPAAPEPAVESPVPVQRRGERGTRLLLVAAVAGIAGLAAWNVVLQQQLGAARGYTRAVADVVDLAARQGSRLATLSGDNGQGPHGIAAIGADGSVALAMLALDPTVGAEVYQAWAVVPDAGPVPIGSFVVAADGTGSLATRTTPTIGMTIAVTREPAPGGDHPTTPIVAQGVASAQP
jgi:anti-sigma-K factor RskA